MTSPDPSEITVLLKAWGGGDSTALDRLAPVVYEELRRKTTSIRAGAPAGV